MWFGNAFIYVKQNEMFWSNKMHNWTQKLSFQKHYKNIHPQQCQRKHIHFQTVPKKNKTFIISKFFERLPLRGDVDSIELKEYHFKLFVNFGDLRNSESRRSRQHLGTLSPSEKRCTNLSITAWPHKQVVQPSLRRTVSAVEHNLFTNHVTEWSCIEQIKT